MLQLRSKPYRIVGSQESKYNLQNFYQDWKWLGQLAAPGMNVWRCREVHTWLNWTKHQFVFFFCQGNFSWIVHIQCDVIKMSLWDGQGWSIWNFCLKPQTHQICSQRQEDEWKKVPLELSEPHKCYLYHLDLKEFDGCPTCRAKWKMDACNRAAASPRTAHYQSSFTHSRFNGKLGSVIKQLLENIKEKYLKR